MSEERKAAQIGPRGGTTTRSNDRELIRKAFLLRVDEEEALRRAAFEQRRSEASIVRQLLRESFGLDDDGDFED